MMYLTIPGREMYSDTENLFTTLPSVTLQLEHSLRSIALWESKWRKPFLTNEPKTNREFRDYIRCMTINKVEPDVYVRLGPNEFQKVQAYIDDPMTATVVTDLRNKKTKRRTITSELIYYWMASAQIPYETDKWHFNRLMTLLRVADAEGDTGKMSKKEVYNQNKALNMARRAKYHSKG